MPKPPILFNRLGSSTQTTHSVIGSNGTGVDSPTYAAGMFDNGVNLTTFAVLDKITFPYVYTPAATIELWLKPNFNYDAADGQTGYMFDMRDGTENVPISYYHNSHKLFVFWMPNAAGNGRTQVYYNALPWVANDLVHLTWVWDSAGIEGTSVYRRLYQNSNILYVAGSSPSQPTVAIYGSNISSNILLNLGNYHLGNNAAKGVIDNVKIYDYAKTDFSDRRNERGGLNDQAIII